MKSRRKKMIIGRITLLGALAIAALLAAVGGAVAHAGQGGGSVKGVNRRVLVENPGVVKVTRDTTIRVVYLVKQGAADIAFVSSSTGDLLASMGCKPGVLFAGGDPFLCEIPVSQITRAAFSDGPSLPV